MERDMEKPLFIDKADDSDLPMIWRDNPEAWNKARIMEEWLLSFDQRITDGPMIILFLDDVISCVTSSKNHKHRSTNTSRNCVKVFNAVFLTAVVSADKVSVAVKNVSVLDGMHWFN
ncbi:hypothetical protein J437_LFUL000526 [Ladona fulva]|uniref:DDE-1 domain-containing protein n=1 Tax=Ladona fulva TaxID=123851 RepID=A0A8K0NUG6_LADFU|nr:hypothetical protein J437_LFUL000526 [Ladona fulva]